MAKRSTKATAVEAPAAPTPVDPFAYIRTELLEIAPVCEHRQFMRGVKIAPLAAEIGIAPVALSDYLRDDKPLGRVSLTKIANFLAGRKGVETAEQADAVAAVEALA